LSWGNSIDRASHVRLRVSFDRALRRAPPSLLFPPQFPPQFCNARVERQRPSTDASMQWQRQTRPPGLSWGNSIDRASRVRLRVSFDRASRRAPPSLLLFASSGRVVNENTLTRRRGGGCQQSYRVNEWKLTRFLVHERFRHSRTPRGQKLSKFRRRYGIT
jgi:hypothetical protein